MYHVLELSASETSDPMPTTLEDYEAENRRLNPTIKALEKNSVQSRRQELQANHDMQQQQGDKVGARAIRNIMIAEDNKEMWRQLRSLNPVPDSDITTIEAPTNGDLTTPNCKTCEFWTLLTDPVEIRHALICRNRLHFGQAQETFPTTPIFTDAMDWAASTPRF
jgi:DNA phosphorothioation-dependent restriction protein DptG